MCVWIIYIFVTQREEYHNTRAEGKFQNTFYKEETGILAVSSLMNMFFIYISMCKCFNLKNSEKQK